MGRKRAQPLEDMWKLGFEAGKNSALPVKEDKRREYFLEARVIIADCVREFKEKWENDPVWKMPYAMNRVHHLHSEIQRRLELAYNPLKAKKKP